MSGRLASVGLVSVLSILILVAFWNSLATSSATATVQRATDFSDRGAQLRFLVQAQESTERLYRLEPGLAAQRQFDGTAQALSDALHELHLRAAAADLPSIDDLQRRLGDYREVSPRLFAAIDARDSAEVSTIEEHEAGPLLAELGSRVDAAAARYRAEAQDSLDALAAVRRRDASVTPLVYAFGIGFGAFFWRGQRHSRRQAAEATTREAALVRRSERRLRGLVQNASDLILICANGGTITYHSPAAETAWQYAADALVGEPLISLTHPDDRPALRLMWDQLRQIAPAGSPEITCKVELRLRDGTGEWRQAELVGTNLLHDPALAGIVVATRDITERKVHEQQLTQQTFYDALTGLPNRVLLRDRIEQSLVRAARRKDAVGVVFIDLDNFKLINDSLGHHMGDRLLIEAAARLRSCIRAQDTVARLSGDEFVIVLDPLQAGDDALPIANAIQHQFSRPVLLDGRELIISASVGIVIGSPERDTADTLLRDADVAIYRAKSEGRARAVIFDPTMKSDFLARLELESDLRHALANDELRVHYQPIVVMGTGAVSEVEALVRWQHPRRGLVSPVEFIPLAEETGLIIPLGMWVLEDACRQVAEWQMLFPSEPPLTVSVNLSPRQFQQQTLVADIVQALQSSRLPASCLKLEITEGIIMRDAEATIRTLWELKQLGVQLAIDDFGTGYSSLSYLKRLPLDVLKIDRTFVSGLGHSHEDTAIVHAIMVLAKSLGLKVTGEGIETEEQAALLGQWGCDCGQGYLFSKALDRENTEALLEAAAAARSVASGRSRLASAAE